MLSNWEVPGKHITFRNSCFEIPCWKKSLAVIHSMLSPNRNGCDHHMNWNPGHFVLRFLQRKSSKVHSDQMVPAESDQLVEFDGIWGLNTHSAKCVFFFNHRSRSSSSKKDSDILTMKIRKFSTMEPLKSHMGRKSRAVKSDVFPSEWSFLLGKSS